MKRNSKLMLAGLLLLVFAAVKLLMLAWWQKQQPQAVQAECDAVQGCTLPNGVYAKIDALVSAKQPFDVVLTQVPPDAAEASVSFSMKNMDMGFNRYKLKREVDGTWAARQIRLPLCVERRSDYLMDVHIGGQVFQTAFTAQPE